MPSKSPTLADLDDAKSLGVAHAERLVQSKIFYGALRGRRRHADDLREAVATNGEIERTARRVLGSVHPVTGKVGV